MSLNLSDLHSRIFDRHLRSRPKTLFTDHVDPFLQELLPRTWYIPTLLKLRLAQQLGHYTLILSNSPDFLVEPIAKSLGVDEWRATEYMTDEEGKFDKVGFVCHGAAKAETLRLLCHKLRINRQNTHVYTDSIHDLELLRIAGHPTVVNPDRQLRKISQAEGWQIL